MDLRVYIVVVQDRKGDLFRCLWNMIRRLELCDVHVATHLINHSLIRETWVREIYQSGDE